MKIFISGGCKNGKSTLAQRLAAHRDLRYYIATMTACDAEDEERILRHRQERVGMGFVTIEQPNRIEDILTKCDVSGSFLLDSLTALLSNEMFAQQGECDKFACNRIARGLADVLDNIQNIVIVSDYIYSDAMQYDPLTELYRKSLACLDRAVAARCDVVLEVTFTQIIVHKGEEMYREALV